MKFNNKVYDTLKWIAQYLLPALATLWLTFGKIWNFPYTTEIGASISAVDIFLGAILGISSKNYEGDGTMIVNETDPNKDTYTLSLNGPVTDLSNMDMVTFKVTKES